MGAPVRLSAAHGPTGFALLIDPAPHDLGVSGFTVVFGKRANGGDGLRVRGTGICRPPYTETSCGGPGEVSSLGVSRRSSQRRRGGVATSLTGGMVPYRVTAARV